MVRRTRPVKVGLPFFDIIGEIESEVYIEKGRKPSRADITDAITPLVRRRKEDILRKLMR